MVSGSGSRDSRMRWVLWGALALVPFIGLVWFLVKFSVDVPFWDDWALIPFLEKSYQGTLTLADLWKQENEHRLFFPKIIFILFARLGGWNAAWMLVLNIILAAGTFAVLAYQIKLTLAETVHSGMGGLLPILSLIVFSLSQWENWLWGAGVCIFLNTLAVISGLLVLCAPVFKWRHFLAACILGVVGTYSNANGLIFWPLGLWVLWASSSSDRKVKALRMELWELLGLLVILSYLYRYSKPAHHPSVWIFLQRPFGYAEFVLTYLGASLVSFSRKGAFWAGLGGLAVFSFAPVILRRPPKIPFRALIPHLCVGLYFVGTAFMVGIGRLGFGTKTAMRSHYITQAYPFWISTLIFLHLLIHPGALKQGRYSSRLWGCVFSAAVLLGCLSSLYGIVGFRRFHERLSAGRAELLSRKEGAPLKLLTPIQPPALDERIAVLRKHRLSVFRHE